MATTVREPGPVEGLEARWQAVLARDERYDGAFVYAVRTTGVYCRPSCPSKRPHPDNVAFFPVPEAAEAAGFRPCLRCRPASMSSVDPQVELVRTACRFIHRYEEGVPTMRDLCAGSGVRPQRLQQAFKAVLGITPRQYADALRLQRLKGMLRDGSDVTTALYQVGYGSASRLYEQAAARLGMTPASYRRGGQGAVIAYVMTDSPLGRLLVGATEKGVCKIAMAADDAALEEGLRREYPRATLVRGEAAGLGEWVRCVLDYLEGTVPSVDLPLDVLGTAFQRRVWEALRTIPYGDTCSYRRVAEVIDMPRAVRAVARACAANPVPLVVPCHRVVKSDGGLGGYRFGAQRKAELLAWERERGERFERR